MKKEAFKKGIREMQNVKLTDTEKSAMLERIFATPVVSPYSKYFRVFAYVQRSAVVVTTLSLILVFGSVTYAAESALPGDVLYPVKIKIFEPIMDKLKVVPEKKLEWEERKVERRIQEAEALADKGKLDEEKTQELEKKIEKSSTAFREALDEASLKEATSTTGRKEKTEERKSKFIEKWEEKKSSDSSKEIGEEKEKIKRLKDTAVKSFEKKERGEGR